MKLYEINSEIEACVAISENEAVNTETGEVISIDYLEHLKMDRDEKLENIIKFYKNLNAEADVLKSEADKLAKRAKAARNKADQLKAYLGYCLKGEKFKSADGVHSVSYRKSEKVDIQNINAIPLNYLKIADPEADKTAIKEVLKKGIEVPGAVLVEAQNVQIR